MFEFAKLFIQRMPVARSIGAPTLLEKVGTAVCTVVPSLVTLFSTVGAVVEVSLWSVHELRMKYREAPNRRNDANDLPSLAITFVFCFELVKSTHLISSGFPKRFDMPV